MLNCYLAVNCSQEPTPSPSPILALFQRVSTTAHREVEPPVNFYPAILLLISIMETILKCWLTYSVRPIQMMENWRLVVEVGTNQMHFLCFRTGTRAEAHLFLLTAIKILIFISVISTIIGYCTIYIPWFPNAFKMNIQWFVLALWPNG